MAKPSIGVLQRRLQKTRISRLLPKKFALFRIAPLNLLENVRPADRSPTSPSSRIRAAVNLAHLLAVVALDGDRGDVLPAEPVYDLDHGLRLEVVRRHHPAEVLEAALVRQLGARRGVAYLRDLQRERWYDFPLAPD